MKLSLSCLLLLFLCCSSSLYAAECPTIEPLMDLREGLSAPTRTVVDSNGNFYIADPRQQAVLMFDSVGTLKNRFESAPVSGSGLAVSTDGRQLFIADLQTVNIVDTSTDQVIGHLGAADEFRLTGSIALDAEGRVFVADRGERLIKVYQVQFSAENVQGQLLYSFGHGRFTSIFAMAVDRGRESVYVADGILTYSTQRRVDVFDLNGTWQRDLSFDSSFGTENLSFAGAIDFDDAERIYVADRQNGNLRVLSSDGDFLCSQLHSGHSVGSLWQPRGLAYLPGTLPGTGQLLVANSDGRVGIFSLGTEPSEDPTSSLLPIEQQLEEKVAQLHVLDNGRQKTLINRIAGELNRGNLIRAAKMAARLARKTDGPLAAAATELVALLQ